MHRRGAGPTFAHTLEALRCRSAVCSCHRAGRPCCWASHSSALQPARDSVCAPGYQAREQRPPQGQAAAMLLGMGALLPSCPLPRRRGRLQAPPRQLARASEDDYSGHHSSVQEGAPPARRCCRTAGAPCPSARAGVQAWPPSYSSRSASGGCAPAAGSPRLPGQVLEGGERAAPADAGGGGGRAKALCREGPGRGARPSCALRLWPSRQVTDPGYADGGRSAADQGHRSGQV